MAGVLCQVSCVRCHMSCAMCHLIFFFFFLDNPIWLVGGWSETISSSQNILKLGKTTLKMRPKPKQQSSRKPNYKLFRVTLLQSVHYPYLLPGADCELGVDLLAPLPAPGLHHQPPGHHHHHQGGDHVCRGEADYWLLPAPPPSPPAPQLITVSFLHLLPVIQRPK